MKKVTIGYIVNDNESFNRSVMSNVMEDMKHYDESKNYTAFAVSHGDEFGRLESIDEILNDSDLSDSEKIDEINIEMSRVR